MRDERPLFLDELPSPAQTDQPNPGQGADGPWLIAVVDDDEGIHAVTRLVLREFRYKGRPLRILDAYSAAQARTLLDQQPDLAVVLLDVVMETEHAGLDLVKFIREELGNSMLRIILRTGQPGLAPEGRVITEYDINDYKEKQELTSQKLITAVTTALRGYDDLRTIQNLSNSKEILEQMVQKRTAELLASNRLLQQQRMLLSEAQKIASIGHYEWSPNSRELVCSDQIYRILGIDVSSGRLSLERLLDLIPASDRQAVWAGIERAVGGHGGYDCEHPIRLGDGSLGHVYHQGEAHFDERGQVWRVIGILQDVTERYRAAATTRKLSTAIEQTADAVMITDAAGVIEYVNPAFTTMVGYASSEAIGQTPRLLRSGKMPEMFYRRMWQTLCKGEVFSDLFLNKRKDGSLFHQAVTITPQRDRQGQITHFIATGRDISEQIRTQERIQHLAHHDVLTGLPNRLLLTERLEQAMSRSKWHNRHVAVLFMDMDRFKVINDTLGHETGDELLQAMAWRLNSCVGGGDTVARLGGDEFAIVLNDVGTRDDIGQRAQRVLDAVKQPFVIDGRELFVTTCIGISVYPQDGQNSQTLLRRSDVAMYNAKILGKSNYQFYAQHDEARDLARLNLETDLRRALERDEFFLLYQPQVDAQTLAVRGMEALLRWRRRDGRVVAPAEFISLLEETGMILEVGDWMLRQACQAAQAWRLAGMAERRVAVNIAIQQFRQKDFVARVREVLIQTGLPPAMLELEVTENVLAGDVGQASQILYALNELGVRLSLDDFGTGYSSMHYLRHLPFDLIKIDKSFIDGLPQNGDDCAIVSAIVALAHSLELDVLAAGVERREQYDFVRAQGCQLVQGPLCGQPVSAQAIHQDPQGGSAIAQ